MLVVAVITVVLIILGTLAAIVQNVAAAAAKWPGPFDYLRQYPWPSMGGIGILIAVGSLWILRVQSKKPRALEEEAGERTDPTKRADFSNSTINGNVLISQGEKSPVVQNGMFHAETSRTEAAVGEVVGRAVIPYIISNFLGTGGWEEAIFDGVRDAGASIECLPLEPNAPKVTGAPALIVVVSAAQFVAIKRKTTTRLRAARPDHPDARVLVFAADRSEESFKEDDGRALAKAAGYSEECTRIITCPTVDVFRREVASHIRNVVRTAIVQAKLDVVDNSEEGMEGVS